MTELQALTGDEAERLERMRKREASRVRMLVTISLPILVIMCIALAAGMDISSIYIVTGGVVAGLLLWGLLMNFLPLSEGSIAHRVLIEGDRTEDEQQLLVREAAVRNEESNQVSES